MLVKSFTWCGMTLLALFASAMLFAAPVSATNNDNKPQDPTLVVIAGGCVDPGMLEGTLDVTLTNPNDHDKTYTITVGSVQKTLDVPAHDTRDIAFTELAAGDYLIDVAGPYDTKASATATIGECHVNELPIVAVDSCDCVAPDAHDGRLTLHITNPNDYAVTYTVRVGWRTKDVFVDSRATESISFGHLRAGDYNISITGDDCTSLCLWATVHRCPQEEPEQPGQGGGTTPPVVAPVAPQTTPAAAQPLLPAELPNTSAMPAEKAVAATSPSTAPTAWLVIAAAFVAYAAVRRGILANKSN